MPQSLNLKLLAETLVKLRENMQLTQTEAARQAEIDFFVLNRLEHAKVLRPTFEDLAPLARLYGLDLNQVGAILGVWELEAQEAELYPPEAVKVLQNLRQAMRELPPEELEAYVGLIRLAIQMADAWLRQQRGPEEAGEPTQVDGLPPWLQIRPRKR